MTQIETLPLNTVMAETHKAVATGRRVSKDMAWVSKRTNIAADHDVAKEWMEANTKIKLWEEKLQKVEKALGETSELASSNHEKLLDELAAQMTIAEKAKKMSKVAKDKINWLTAEMR